MPQPQATSGFDRLGLLARLIPSRGAAVVSQALPFAEDHERSGLAMHLIERASLGLGKRSSRTKKRYRRSSAWIELCLGTVIGQWSRLEHDVRAAAQSLQGVDWPTALGASIASERPDDRASAAIFMRDLQDPELLAMIGPLLADAEPRVAEAAERAILAMVDALTGSLRPGRASVIVETLSYSERLAKRHAFETGLAVILGQFPRHRRRGTLLAAIAMLDDAALSRSRERSLSGASPIAQWLVQADAETLSAFRLVLRTGRESLTRERAWGLLGVVGLQEAIGQAARDRLGVAHHPEDHEVVLRKGYWVLNPVRAASLGGGAHEWPTTSEGDGKTPQPARSRTLALVPPPRVLGKISVVARREIPRLLRMGLPDRGPAAREAMLSSYESVAITDPDASVRFGFAMTLNGESLRDLCFDTDESIAFMATMRWLDAIETSRDAKQRADARKVMEHLMRSPHARVRLVVERAVSESKAWGCGAAGARLSVRRALRANRHDFLAQLCARVEVGPAETRIEAIKVATDLNLLGEIEAVLIAVIQPAVKGKEVIEGHERVRSAAVAALGGVKTPTARAIVRRMLKDVDPRVRANAVEACVDARFTKGDLAASDRELYAALVELKNDPNHRVRANSARALVHAARQASDGRGPVHEPVVKRTLDEMLVDDKPMHRIAGLWLAGTLVAGPGPSVFGGDSNALAARIAELAKDDPEEAVRARALRCAHRWLRATNAVPGRIATAAQPANALFPEVRTVPNRVTIAANGGQR